MAHRAFLTYHFDDFVWPIVSNPDRAQVEMLMRTATDQEQRAAIVAAARQHVQRDGADHRCRQWTVDGVCQLCDRVVHNL